LNSDKREAIFLPVERAHPPRIVTDVLAFCANSLKPMAKSAVRGYLAGN